MRRPSRRRSLCTDLFGPDPPPDRVPVAIFTDYACPYCRTLEAQLDADAEALGLAIRRHELPILGPSSVTAARGALAAARQGRYA